MRFSTRFSILGPVQIRSGDDDVKIAAPRERTLLALLLLRENQLVPMQQLIAALWDEAPPPTARAQVHSCVSRLRQLLRRIGVPDDVIVTEPNGYRLRTGDRELDSVLFTTQVERGRAAIVGGDLQAARAALRTALTVWRGRPVADVDSDVVRALAAHLEEQWTAAVALCLDVELRMGLAEEVLAEAADLVERYPHNEQLRGQLMTALAQTGRRADALAVYRRGRALLAEELGIEPGAELDDLHRRILNGDLATVLPQPAPAPQRRPARCLPRDVTDFAGRADLVQRLCATIGAAGSHDALVVAIDGMPGTGKTTLAVRVAHRVADRYPDGQLFLDLHGHSQRDPVDPLVALGILLGQLGVPTEQVPEALDDRIVLWRTELAERQALIVLDNVRDTAQVVPLLPGSSNTATIITSRRRLAGLDGVQPLSLDVLEPREAVEMLRRTVGERVRADPESAAEVAELCGRLPLAVRLAAARLQHRPTWTVADLVARLRDAEARLAELSVDGRTVAAAFTLSYQHLPEPAQRVFRALGLHPAGTFEAAAAAALVDLPVPEVTSILEELVDAHLVEAPAAGRYRLHDLLRNYAARLVDPAAADQAINRLLDHYLHSTTNATAQMESPHTRAVLAFPVPLPSARTFDDTGSALAWLNAELPNIVAVADLAQERAMYRHVCLLARALWAFLYNHGYTTESLTISDRALAAAQELGDPELEGISHNYLAALHFRRCQYADARAHLDRAAAIAERAGLTQLETSVHGNLAIILYRIGEYEASLRAAGRVAELSERSGVPMPAQRIRAVVGQVYLYTGRYARALAELRGAALWARRSGMERDYAVALGEIGRTHLRMGHFTVATAMLKRALSLKQQTGNRYGYAEALSELGVAYRGQGRLEDALRCQRAALGQMVELADLAGQCKTSNDLGDTLRAIGAEREALELHRQALDYATRIGDRYEQARALTGLGRAEEAEAITRELGVPSMRQPLGCRSTRRRRELT